MAPKVKMGLSLLEAEGGKVVSFSINDGMCGPFPTPDQLLLFFAATLGMTTQRL